MPPLPENDLENVIRAPMNVGAGMKHQDVWPGFGSSVDPSRVDRVQQALRVKVETSNSFDDPHRAVKKLFAAAVFDVRQLRRIEQEVMQGSDESVLAFKSAHLASIGQTSVASAIIAQLGMTTLHLSGLDSVHWTAPGFVIASLLFGLLSLLVTCWQQQNLGMLNEPHGVRLWLSNGRYTSSGKNYQPGREEALMQEDSESKPKLQASVAALVVLRMPNAFLTYGVVCFLTGMGLYLGFSYKHDLQNTPGRNNNEAVMVLFLVVAAVGIVEAGLATGWKFSESNYTDRVIDDSNGRPNGHGKNSNGNSGRGEDSEGADERSPLLSKAGKSDGSKADIRDALQAMAKAHDECAKAERRLTQLLERE